jgi:4-amino-4-deoxy-L-arabinose transferase-like glycosyltransferase
VNLLADSPAAAFSVAEKPARALTTTKSDHLPLAIGGFALVLLVGIFFRLPQSVFLGDHNPLHALAPLHPASKYTQMGMVGADEDLYRRFVIDLSVHGLSSYPLIVEHYIEVQKRANKALLPPSRFLYIFTTYIWCSCFGSDPLIGLAEVASIFNILTLLVSGVFAWRLGGRGAAIAVTALMSCAPTQIHMSQHAMIDGFFTFWALLCLWTLWENLRTPRDWRWIAAYTGALALLVLTKENAFFVWIALVAIICSNRWLKIGTETRELFLATIVGPLLGVVTLLCLAGGWENVIEMYRLLVIKASVSTYAIQTGDGPWFRYIADLVMVSPLVTLLAVGTIFRINRTMKAELFLIIFIAASYLIMCNVKYGMNLRYANMWDMPLRFLAFSQIVALTQHARRYALALCALCVLVVATLELRQFYILTVKYPLYELVTHHLLRALQILK